MDALTIIFVAMAAILFGYGGYVLGNYFPLIKRDKKPKLDMVIASEKESEKSPEADEKLKEDGEEIEPKPDVFEKTERVIPASMKSGETIQLWYDKKEHRTVAEIDGEIIDIEEELTDKQQRILTWLLIDLQERVGLLNSVKDQMGGDEKEEEEKNTESTKLNPMQAMVNYIKSDVPKIEEKKTSMPEQINDILQEQLEKSALKSKGISVTEWPNKGVVFMVGLDIYENIDKIPNKRIQNAIKKAVKTWEETHESEN